MEIAMHEEQVEEMLPVPEVTEHTSKAFEDFLALIHRDNFPLWLKITGWD